MENRKLIGLALIIIGIVFIFLYIGSLFIILLGALCIIGGIYLSISKPKPLPEDIDPVKKRSKLFFIAGTIFIGFGSLGILFDSVYYSGGFSGIITFYFALPAYFFGVLFIAYSIHLIGNKWGWLDFPIALIICIAALFQIIWVLHPINHPNEFFGYRLAWFLVFPLNFIPLLILFMLSVRKSANKE
jgi:hypothetical protein